MNLVPAVLVAGDHGDDAEFEVIGGELADHNLTEDADEVEFAFTGDGGEVADAEVVDFHECILTFRDYFFY